VPGPACAQAEKDETTVKKMMQRMIRGDEELLNQVLKEIRGRLQPGKKP
jgi:hypothetical protein